MDRVSGAAAVLHSIEEIFEMLAAQLFCAATLLTLLKDAGD